MRYKTINLVTFDVAIIILGGFEMKNYETEIEETYTPLKVMEEATRCLLCHDAPCSKECPAQTNPGKFIRSVRFKNFKGAAKTIRENNFLGDVCARVCPTEKYCQKGCSRSGLDKPIEIGKIQQYVTDYEASLKMKILSRGSEKKKTIAIIGSGPAGLQAAASLSILGYSVVIYEKEAQAGGYLRYGIPSYRLPEKVLDKDIKTLEKDLKVKIIYNHNISTQQELEEIQSKYDAVILSIGMSKAKSLDLFKNSEIVETAIDFLKRVKVSKGNIEHYSNVLVIGGGDVAMDVCSTLKILGTENVTDVIFENSDELRASKAELALARQMNVNLICGYYPIEFSNNIVKFKSRNVDSELTIKSEKIILAIGQQIDTQSLSLCVENNQISNKSFKTSNNLFVCGDIANNDKTVVYAIKNGKEVAELVHKALSKKKGVK